jgi:hypothetical protein
MLNREITQKLSKVLNETNIGCMGTGIYTTQEIYIRVKENYTALCNDNYLCIESCQSGNKSPEWQHVIRTNMQTMKRRGRIFPVVRGTWKFVEITG